MGWELGKCGLGVSGAFWGDGGGGGWGALEG